MLGSDATVERDSTPRRVAVNALSEVALVPKYSIGQTADANAQTAPEGSAAALRLSIQTNAGVCAAIPIRGVDIHSRSSTPTRVDANAFG